MTALIESHVSPRKGRFAQYEVRREHANVIKKCAKFDTADLGEIETYRRKWRLSDFRDSERAFMKREEANAFNPVLEVYKGTINTAAKT